MSSTNSNDDNTAITYEDENEDEIKRYTDKDGHYTIIAVFEGDYVRFARVWEWRIGRRKIVQQEEFEKMIEQERLRKEKDE